MVPGVGHEQEKEQETLNLNEENADDRGGGRKVTRKRIRNPEKWACNIRKQKFDRGLEYISTRKKLRPARKIISKKDCTEKCIYKCAKKISEEDRNQIFTDYYKLDAKEKRMFILNTTERSNPERRRKGKNCENSKKVNSYRYFFIINNNKIQVCKIFYCGTLSISQKPIYTVHKHSTETHTLRKSNQGKHKKKHTSNEDADLVRQHINMFPVIESHYCRSDTKRQYIEGDLSLQKMYDLYKDFISANGSNPVKIHIYRKIFCTEFNYSFNKPSKDLCDLCAEVDLKTRENNLNNDNKIDEYEKHLGEKKLMREEKKKRYRKWKRINVF